MLATLAVIKLNQHFVYFRREIFSILVFVVVTVEVIKYLC
jgi:hypothetical protein